MGDPTYYLLNNTILCANLDLLGIEWPIDFESRIDSLEFNTCLLFIFHNCRTGHHQS